MKVEDTIKLKEASVRSQMIMAKEHGVPLTGVHTLQDWLTDETNVVKSAHTYFHAANCALLANRIDTAQHYAGKMRNCEDFTDEMFGDYLADESLYWCRHLKFNKAREILSRSDKLVLDPNKKLRNRMFQGRIALASGNSYAVQIFWEVYNEFRSMLRNGQEIDTTYMLNDMFWAVVAAARFPQRSVKAPPPLNKPLVQIGLDYLEGIPKDMYGSDWIKETRERKRSVINKILMASAPMRWTMAVAIIYKR